MKYFLHSKFFTFHCPALRMTKAESQDLHKSRKGADIYDYYLSLCLKIQHSHLTLKVAELEPYYILQLAKPRNSCLTMCH